MRAVGRLAPTPSGRLHLGNACAFAAAWLSLRQAGGRMLLRMEDVDTTRARDAFTTSIREDLSWLRLDHDHEVEAQSARDYAPWLARLEGHVYYCTCTRKQLRQTGGVYPGTCREAGHTQGAVRLRLPTDTVRFTDRRFGERQIDPGAFGDPVLRRRDGIWAYSLAVVADDIADGVTEVVRGADLLDYTAVQIVLWRLLGASTPSWLHTPLILGPNGRKLSKSHASTELARLREAGWTASDVWRTVLPWLGLEGDDLSAAVPHFDASAGPLGPITTRAELLPR